jgi:uncharacterized protein with PQ loop repeat
MMISSFIFTYVATLTVGVRQAASVHDTAAAALHQIAKNTAKIDTITPPPPAGPAKQEQQQQQLRSTQLFSSQQIGTGMVATKELTLRMEPAPAAASSAQNQSSGTSLKATDVVAANGSAKVALTASGSEEHSALAKVPEANVTGVKGARTLSEEPAASESSTTSWTRVHFPTLWLLLHGITFGFVIKAICMVGNVMVQVSPIPQVKGWELKGNTGDVDAAPYVSIAFTGWNWCFYGLFAYFVTQRSGFVILVYANCLGAVLGSYYMWAFSKFCSDRGAMANFQKYLSAAAGLVGFELCMVLTLPMERSLFMCGLVSSFCSFTAAVSLLMLVPSVMRTKDSSSISGPLVVANFGSAIAWFICGWMLQDPLVYSPNLMTSCASLLCIYLKVKYSSTSSLRTISKYVDAQELSDLGEEDRALVDKAAAVLNALWRKKQGNDAVPSEFTPLTASVPAPGAGRRLVAATRFGGTSGRVGDYVDLQEKTLTTDYSDLAAQQGSMLSETGGTF